METFKKLISIKTIANNKIMKTTLIITLFLTSILVNAQDTIYFNNKTIVAAKITEVGVSEIKYQRLDNLNGPSYASAKNEISLIRYSNGVVDTIKFIETASAAIVTNAEFVSNPKQMRLRGSRLIYNNKAISDRRLRFIIADLPASETQVRLKKEFKKLNEYRLKEAALGPGLFITGTVIHGYALSQLFDSGYSYANQSNVVSTFIAGAVLRISGHVVNTVYRNKKKSKREEIADIYNGLK